MENKFAQTYLNAMYYYLIFSKFTIYLYSMYHVPKSITVNYQLSFKNRCNTLYIFF